MAVDGKNNAKLTPLVGKTPERVMAYFKHLPVQSATFSAI
mgnify:FL=1